MLTDAQIDEIRDCISVGTEWNYAGAIEDLLADRAALLQQLAIARGERDGARSAADQLQQELAEAQQARWEAEWREAVLRQALEMAKARIEVSVAREDVAWLIQPIIAALAQPAGQGTQLARDVYAECLASVCEPSECVTCGGLRHACAARASRLWALRDRAKAAGWGGDETC